MGYVVVDATEWQLAGDETEGATPHGWLRQLDDGPMYLWKPATEKRLDRREHLAEKVAGELAAVLRVPCAKIELASRQGVIGCLSRDVRPRKTDRRSGADMLRSIDPSFRAEERHSAYTISNIASVLVDVGAPVEAATGLADFSAFDVFTGYLVFDALILNRDRHAANWGIWQPRDGSRRVLSALYDNASSFGLAMSEERADGRLRAKGVDAYTRREDHARRFELGPEPKLIDVAAAAMRLCSPRAKEYWRDRLAQLEVEAVVTIVDQVDDLSDVHRRLVVEVVRCTQRRLLDEL